MSVTAAHPGAALRVYTFAEARGPRRLSGRWRELGAWRWGGRDNWERTACGWRITNLPRNPLRYPVL